MPLTDITVDWSRQDGNAFAVMGSVTQALKRGGRADLIEPFRKEAMSGDYDNLLRTCGKYVEIEMGSDEDEDCPECDGTGEYQYNDDEEDTCDYCGGDGRA